MRYLLRLLCVCALGVMPVVGCSDGDPSTIGSVFPTIDAVTIENNLWYSWGTSWDDEYVVDVEALTVTYNADTTADVTPDAMHMLVQTIQGAVYRVNDICESVYHLDSGVLPPKIVIRQGAEHGTFSVSDNDCARLRLLYNPGPVIGCDDYTEILRQLKDMAVLFYNDPFWCSDLW